ncbi:MAG: SpoIID/LytB domain-containing protein [Bacillota bacterium]|nr:SpoIID/LytB domain-containing protein [Bacillota bacterium]MDW7683060.1 SpoIID/LytB domain-containing protein [Bacillota bacterium]
MSKKKICLFVLLISIVLIMTAGGCSRLQRAPERTPQPLFPAREPRPPRGPARPPAIPAPIRQDGNEEPELRVYIAEQNQVKTMKMEEYLMGVVAAEMDPTWEQAALAAQAIIARSFTLQKIDENGGVPDRNAHASTDIKEFQAYDASRINDNVREAVEKTRGQVAVYGNEFIRGWFHAYAGPRTALAREGLEFRGPNPPYIHIVDSPAEEIIPEEERDWKAAFPLERVRNVVRQATGTDPGSITQVEIAQRGPSRRVTQFRVNDQEVSAPQLRLGLGSTEMRSTFVSNIRIEGNRLVMSGTGYGHGVGMCQWGARAMADDGKSAEEIVKYYFRNVEIVDLWE